MGDRMGHQEYSLRMRPARQLGQLQAVAMRRRSTRSTLLAIAISVVGSDPGQGQSSTEAPTFVLQAGARSAPAINEVLSRLAEPILVLVPVGLTPEAFLERICAAKPTEFRPMESERGTRIQMSPCVRVRRNVEVEALPGDTFEKLATSKGLPASARGSDEGQSLEPRSLVRLNQRPCRSVTSS